MQEGQVGARPLSAERGTSSREARRPTPLPGSTPHWEADRSRGGRTADFQFAPSRLWATTPGRRSQFRVYASGTPAASSTWSCTCLQPSWSDVPAKPPSQTLAPRALAHRARSTPDPACSQQENSVPVEAHSPHRTGPGLLCPALRVWPHVWGASPLY